MRAVSFSFIGELTEVASPGDKLSDWSEQLFWRGEGGWGVMPKASLLCAWVLNHISETRVLGEVRKG